eukprot:TRINITY_DN31173_c0_g1_i1.p1 TRINITY_DN31173_c0_g1~~TRINITY_DN31173_c0_g1_i1.p1  ORF type:complete len:123 (-),score=9.24 TRINITY_DN31173_c0_g1_i1:32-400(-)
MSAVRTGGLYGGKTGADKSISPRNAATTGLAAAAMNNRGRGDFSPSGDSSGRDDSNDSSRNIHQPSISMPPSGGAAAAAGGFHSRGNSFSSVSYTHLTLPTKRIVEISGVGGSFKTKQREQN